MSRFNQVVADPKTDYLIDCCDMFFVSHTFLTVGAGETAFLRHVTGPTKHLHSIAEIEAVGQWELKSYAGTTYTSNGTLLSPIRRRSDGTTFMESVFYHSPVVDTLGTVRLCKTFGSGSQPSRVSTGQSGGMKSVFAPNADVLIGLENQTLAEQYVSIVLNVYENVLN